MTTLRLTRSNEYANRRRSIKILIDGKEAGKVDNGETKNFEVESGSHTVQAKIDWCSSRKVNFDISDNETRLFALNSFANGNILALFMTSYYITFGANRYLKLEEI